ncbi:MAG TPA: M48 family metallopeptidase [Thermodesulfobacteriota bacterium]|nr:M48 family metallopeptidase [Thermodesulfobacteriota bacterium]
MELLNIPYKISHRDVRYPRLEFKTGELLFVLPLGFNPEKVFSKHQKWIQDKFAFIEGCLKDAPPGKIVTRTEKEFQSLALFFAKRSSQELNVTPNRIYFRKMRTKWASLSAKGNLTINTLMKYLPEYLIKYIIFHELTHLKVKRHNEIFWKIIFKRFKNLPKIEKNLFSYWFSIVALKMS